MDSSSVSVLVPSRGRPESMASLALAFGETCAEGSTQLHWIIDQDDPCLEEYRDAYHASVNTVWKNQSLWTVPKGQPGIVHPLNYVVKIMVSPEERLDTSRVLGFMGDDHRPRTQAWDQAIYNFARIHKTRILYGDDLLQGERLPTAVFMTMNIARALGYMAPPELWHLYVDDYWRDLGSATGVLQYLPDIVIEHLHYINFKAEVDATYEQNNNVESARRDMVAYRLFKHSREFRRDVAAVKGLL